MALRLTVAALLALTTAAQAQPCLPRAAMVKALAEQHGEALAGGGLQSDSRLIEVWRATETGTFTVIVTRPDGVSCILVTGQHWHDITAPRGEPS